MIIEIGIVAGEIWHYLDKNGEVLFSKLQAGIQQPRDLVLMSVGWLAQESHVIVREEGKDFRISLRKS